VSSSDRNEPGSGRFVILCGLPGSGKTTVARHLESHLGAVRLSSDEWMTHLGINLYDEDGRARVEALQQALAIDLVRVGVTVLYESGGWTRRERDELRERARAVGASVELRFLDAPLDELWPRLTARNADLPWATGAISRDDLEAWSEKIERPTPDELALYDEPIEG
jgi:predicted kinase